MAKVTTELRKSILKTVPGFQFGLVFSDLRKNKTAVGVKIVNANFTPDQVGLISKSMEEKGFIQICIKKNNSGWNCFNGIRFTFMKPNN